MDDRVQAFLDLYKQQIERFHQTQTVEWKANFGIWSLLAGAIYLTKDRPLCLPVCLMGTVVAAVVLLHGYWLYKIHQSQEVDKELWVRYRGEALALLRENRSLESHERYQKRTLGKELSWLLLEIALTLLLAVFFVFQQHII